VSSGLCWLGHSTVSIELDGVRILTDPLLRLRVAHLRRRAPLPKTPEPLDLVLISHAHRDHLDVPSLRRLPGGAAAVVPVGVGPLLRRLGFADVTELGPGETTEIAGVAIAATRADHRAKRWPGGGLTPSLGFLLGGRRIYFAGDTDLFDELAEFAPVEVALLPVAGWGPTLPAGHLDPAGAAKAARLLQARVAVPIHWGTYSPVGAAPARAAPEEFRREAARLAPGVEVRVLQVGERLALPCG
jgi:L-ascorbate metabolism protein UlaG (beta-lactamase superfamily)